MRAICGAIIAAGALLGLGLTALGIGTRYQNAAFVTRVKTDAKPADGKAADGKAADGKSATTEEEQPRLMHLYQMDRPLVFILVFLTTVAVIGLGIAFFGLAYHHHRRHHEHLREQERVAAQQRTSV